MYPTSSYLILYPSSDPTVLNMTEAMLAHNGFVNVFWFIMCLKASLPQNLNTEVLTIIQRISFVNSNWWNALWETNLPISLAFCNQSQLTKK